MIMKYVYSLKYLTDDKISLSGGKAASLSLMIKNLKINIPYGYVITADAFENKTLKKEAEEEVNGMISLLDASRTYAVRSSALNEDGASSSFAGQYETLTDVKTGNIRSAIDTVILSADNSRVKEYADSFHEDNCGIAVVIQLFIKPDWAGVVFTSDIISGSSRYMCGNYVRGEGEALVSGAENASTFRIDSLEYSYEGADEFKKYARKLFKYCEAIKEYYGMPMDIEWAVSDGKVYILQARPITTLKRADMSCYRINGSYSDNKLLTRTNVGEIFMKPVSPMTFSMLEIINRYLYLPDWLDCICGQPYMNISVMCSAMIAFGMTEEKAFAAIKDLVGNIPEGVAIPVSTFDKKAFLKNLRKLIFPKNRNKLSKAQKHDMVENLVAISGEKIREIQSINSNAELSRYWGSTLLPLINDGLTAVMAECGTQMFPLFLTRGKIAKIAGDETAEKLCGGTLGVLESMRPLLLLEDVISGKLSKEEYVQSCGQRSVNEMEFMEPRPYEDPDYPDNVIEEYRCNNVNVREMRSSEQKKFNNELEEFKKKYPSKSKWIDKKLADFREANAFRESIRSKAVWLICILREYALRVSKINGLGDDVFMFTLEEMVSYVEDGKIDTNVIASRRTQYEKNSMYPPFPALILGRFDPDKWLQDPERRNDFYCADIASGINANCEESTVKGFPGATGRIEGIVRVINDIDHIGDIQKDEILVTTATNIGWTLIFPKVSAIVTDIGAPLSHAAIVAREFGIPAVVGCGNATTVLKTGDRVIVDGSKGTVVRVQS